MANEVATDVTMTNQDYKELEAIADPAAKRERRREQLQARAGESCAHGTPIAERCFLCEPLRLELFPSREKVPTGSRSVVGGRQR